MDDLKAKIKDALEELEYKRVRKDWPEHLVQLGIDVDEAYTWGAEIAGVIEEYHSSIMRLFKMLDEQDPALIPERVYSWVIGRLEVTIPEIEEPMRYMKERLEKLLPPEPEYEDE